MSPQGRVLTQKTWEEWVKTGEHDDDETKETFKEIKETQGRTTRV